ncbi:AAA family ATPase [Streptomyces sp. CO7]
MTGQTTVINPPRTHGRTEELRAVAATLTNRLEDESAVLLLAGEPGLGRTTLLERVARSFGAGPVLRVGATAAESRLPYSGVHAVRCAAGPVVGGPPHVSRTPEGLLDLLRAAADGNPLLLCVDDAHLWDAPSRAALGFAARRLHAAGRVGLLISVTRHHAADPDFAGLPVLRLGPLPRPAARALLDDLVPDGVDPAVADELLTEADGNPALLHALVRRLGPDELAGAARLPRPLTDADVLASVVGRAWPDCPRACTTCCSWPPPRTRPPRPTDGRASTPTWCCAPPHAWARPPPRHPAPSAPPTSSCGPTAGSASRAP